MAHKRIPAKSTRHPKTRALQKLHGVQAIPHAGKPAQAMMAVQMDMTAGNHPANHQASMSAGDAPTNETGSMGVPNATVSSSS